MIRKKRLFLRLGCLSLVLPLCICGLLFRVRYLEDRIADSEAESTLLAASAVYSAMIGNDYPAARLSLSFLPGSGRLPNLYSYLHEPEAGKNDVILPLLEEAIISLAGGGSASDFPYDDINKAAERKKLESLKSHAVNGNRFLQNGYPMSVRDAKAKASEILGDHLTLKAAGGGEGYYRFFCDNAFIELTENSGHLSILSRGHIPGEAVLTAAEAAATTRNTAARYLPQSQKFAIVSESEENGIFLTVFEYLPDPQKTVKLGVSLDIGLLVLFDASSLYR